MNFTPTTITPFVDGRAWAVVGGERFCLPSDAPAYLAGPFPPAALVAHDKPCETCGGGYEKAFQFRDWQTVVMIQDCPDCHDGRRTFDIEIEADYYTEPAHHHVLAEVHRVSIVPGMVLPIYGEDPGDWPDMLTADQPGVIVIKNDGTAVLWDGAGDFTKLILPSAAEPGVYAVQLQVTP